MYDPIIAKSFTRYDRKRLGCCAFIMFTITICSTFWPRLHPFTSTIDHGVNLPLSMNAMLEITSESTEVEMKKMDPVCRILEADADYCEMEGDIRIEANSSTIFLVTSAEKIVGNSTTSWSIQPYPRRGIHYIKKWTIKIVGNINNIPKCTENHKSPAILFSTSGFAGNLFHDFADLILPLYTTSFDFKKDVQFLVSDYQSWWLSKYHEILEKFTRHEILAIDGQKQVHCYKKMVAGLNFHQELIINPLLVESNQTQSSLSMSNFRRLMQETYSLKRTHAMVIRNTTGKGDNLTARRRPRIMIITRNRTRILMNHDEVSQTAQELGFEVVLAEAQKSTNLSRFARLVNSCDVLMGIHGAGLTNMVFLPENAVVIQVVPLGAMDWLAKHDFGEPCVDMKLKYSEYKIGLKESSLSLKYSSDDPVLKDPLSIHRKGWGELRSTYLENQNVTIDIGRFKSTLVEALKLLSH
ncbi:alpha-1,3-arabinosyltransferase XAT3-like [Primulina huaijiensis]|uniref:alpha-1,3-arabinosyltransferase XAT3-like n=1 Tax=Primulina huaijiensis TaxID=1492673 RepID=UPI003CC77CF7